MKYLGKFATEADILMEATPNAVLVEDTGLVLYNVNPAGAYIQHIDGTLYTLDEWVSAEYTESSANGVAIVAKNSRFIFTWLGSGSSSWKWASTAELLNGVSIASTVEEAEKDFNGEANTNILAEACTNCVANWVKTKTFPNGQSSYLPSAGQWKLVANYLAEVNAILTHLSGIGLSVETLWSSTQCDATYAWAFDAKTGELVKKKKTSSYGTRYAAELIK